MHLIAFGCAIAGVLLATWPSRAAASMADSATALENSGITSGRTRPMPGLEPDTPIPTELTLDRKRHVLVLAYGHAGGEQRHELSFEFAAGIRPRPR